MRVYRRPDRDPDRREFLIGGRGEIDEDRG
jgi:hypothetical protein